MIIRYFYLFSGRTFYPGGGTADLVARDESVSALQERVTLKDGYCIVDGKEVDWVHIYDSHHDEVSHFEAGVWSEFAAREVWEPHH